MDLSSPLDVLLLLRLLALRMTGHVPSESVDEIPRKAERRGRTHYNRPKTKEAEKVAVPDFPTIAQLPQWKMQLLHNVVAAYCHEVVVKSGTRRNDL